MDPKQRSEVDSATPLAFERGVARKLTLARGKILSSILEVIYCLNLAKNLQTYQLALNLSAVGWQRFSHKSFEQLFLD